MAVMTEKSADATAIRPFTIEFPEADLEDLRARIAATRWPEKETVDDRVAGRAAGDDAGGRALLGDGVRLAQVRGASSTRCRNFITEIDGLDIHFVHVRSKHEDALPLVVCHGWPGSVIEQLKIVDLLTDPTAHGGERRGRLPPGDPEHAGLRVLGQAGRDRLGPDPHGARLGRADEAPRLRAVRGGRRRLRRARRRLHGRRARRPLAPEPAPPELLGIHTNFPGVVPARRRHGDQDRRRAVARSLSRRATRGRAPRGRVQACGVRRADGDAPADDVRAQRLPGLPGRLHDRPRPDQLRDADPSRLRGRGRGRPDPRRRPRQHHHVLADQHAGSPRRSRTGSTWGTAASPTPGTSPSRWP